MFRSLLLIVMFTLALSGLGRASAAPGQDTRPCSAPCTSACAVQHEAQTARLAGAAPCHQPQAPGCVAHPADGVDAMASSGLMPEPGRSRAMAEPVPWPGSLFPGDPAARDGDPATRGCPDASPLPKGGPAPLDRNGVLRI